MQIYRNRIEPVYEADGASGGSNAGKRFASKRGALIERSKPAVQKTEKRVDRAQSSNLITGINVGLAICACILLAFKGQPSVAWSICAMVAAVYGVPNKFNRFLNK